MRGTAAIVRPHLDREVAAGGPPLADGQQHRHDGRVVEEGREEPHRQAQPEQRAPMAARPAQRGQEQPLYGARLLERTRHDEERACSGTRLAARVRQGPGTDRYERILVHTPSATTFRPGDTELHLPRLDFQRLYLLGCTY